MRIIYKQQFAYNKRKNNPVSQNLSLQWKFIFLSTELTWCI